MAYEERGQVGRWFVTNEVGSKVAYVNSKVRFPNHLEDFHVWSERSQKNSKFQQNTKIKIAGDCVRAHHRASIGGVGGTGELSDFGVDGCPLDAKYRTVKDKDYAILHWTDPVQNDEDHTISYNSGDMAPGSKFMVGRTGVVYTVTMKGKVVRTCDFVVTVVDLDPPVIECHKSIYAKTEYGRADVFVSWKMPDAIDGVDGEVPVVQKSGHPHGGARMAKGSHLIVYESKDSKGNIARCAFSVKVLDQEPPTVFGCPKDRTIEVYEVHSWSARPT